MVPNPDFNEQNQVLSPSVIEMVEEYSEEYENLNSTLDQLDSCLDVLEEQSDSLYEKVAQLLESNRQTRQELEAANQADTKSDNDSTGANEELDVESINKVATIKIQEFSKNEESKPVDETQSDLEAEQTLLCKKCPEKDE